VRDDVIKVEWRHGTLGVRTLGVRPSFGCFMEII
jgi:hypothetical protein